MPAPVPASLLAFDFLTDASKFVQETLWVFALIILFAAIMVYLLAYLSRYFEYLKIQESRYFDVGTLDFIHRVLEWVWIGILIIVIMGIARIRSREVCLAKPFHQYCCLWRGMRDNQRRPRSFPRRHTRINRHGAQKPRQWLEGRRVCTARQSGQR